MLSFLLPVALASLAGSVFHHFPNRTRFCPFCPLLTPGSPRNSCSEQVCYSLQCQPMSQWQNKYYELCVFFSVGIGIGNQTLTILPPSQLELRCRPAIPISFCYLEHTRPQSQTPTCKRPSLLLH